MLRPLCLLLLAIAFAATASAATLSLSSDKTTYNVGETVTLSVFADDEGASTYAIYGRLLYSGALVDNGTRSQVAMVGPSGSWPKYLLEEADSGSATGTYSDAFNQAAANAQSPTNLPGLLSTVTLIASAVGVVEIVWDTTVPHKLSFFALTDAPGTSFTIVPEPATALLLGLGLVALAVSHTRGVHR